MTTHYDNPCITCYECQKGWHPGPHRAVVNAGSTIMLWGTIPAMFETALKLMSIQLAYVPGHHAGSVHDDEANGRTTVFLWLAHHAARRLAEDVWPRCNDIAVEYHRNLMLMRERAGCA